VSSLTRLIEVDDSIASQFAGTLPWTLRLAAGFPREEDRAGMAGRERGATNFLIEHAGEVVGTCGTHGAIVADGSVELGWGLVEQARGRGVGTLAVTELIDVIRARAPRATLCATTQWTDVADAATPVSPASEAILRRLGFSTGEAPRSAGERTWVLATSTRVR
jgi:RimJ/RimL family protein N-acetyltransferase